MEVPEEGVEEAETGAETMDTIEAVEGVPVLILVMECDLLQWI